MFEKALADLEKSIGSLRASLTEYLKVAGKLNNKNWAVDVAKAKMVAVGEVLLAKTRRIALQELLRGKPAPQEAIKRMSNAQERLELLIKKADDLLKEPLIQST